MQQRQVYSPVEGASSGGVAPAVPPKGSHSPPIVQTQTKSVVYETAKDPHQHHCSPTKPGADGDFVPVPEFVSGKTVTSGNRTVETVTVSFVQVI